MKKRNILIITILFLIILLVVITTLFILKKEDKKETEIPTKYSTKAVEVMKQQNIYNKINQKDYSKTIEIMLEESLYKDEYLEEYQKITYQEKIKDFSITVNKLLDKNYKSDEINYILTNEDEFINIILNMDYTNILQFKDITNFDINKLERYLKYQEIHNEYDTKTVVTYVNIGLDLAGYSEYVSYTTEEVKEDLTILVNKYHKLPDDYEPDDLTPLSYSGYKLRKEAAEAYEKLNSAAVLDNVIFYPFSAYRSWKTQNGLYNYYVNRDGQNAADTYSARPGFSEHQLGLAVDVRSNTLTDNLTPEHYEWMLNNSYKYGFIVRYPKGKQHITQFMEEPWHIRYLGIELATKVHDSGLTYDEYYDLYMQSE